MKKMHSSLFKDIPFSILKTFIVIIRVIFEAFFREVTVLKSRISKKFHLRIPVVG